MEQLQNEQEKLKSKIKRLENELLLYNKQHSITHFQRHPSTILMSSMNNGTYRNGRTSARSSRAPSRLGSWTNLDIQNNNLHLQKEENNQIIKNAIKKLNASERLNDRDMEKPDSILPAENCEEDESTASLGKSSKNTISKTCAVM